MDAESSRRGRPGEQEEPAASSAAIAGAQPAPASRKRPIMDQLDTDTSAMRKRIALEPPPVSSPTDSEVEVHLEQARPTAEPAPTAVQALRRPSLEPPEHHQISTRTSSRPARPGRRRKRSASAPALLGSTVAHIADHSSATGAVEHRASPINTASPASLAMLDSAIEPEAGMRRCLEHFETRQRFEQRELQQQRHDQQQLARKLQKGKEKRERAAAQQSQSQQWWQQSWLPPVSTRSVRGLDLRTIMQLSQTRHHVIFDQHLSFSLTPHGERGIAWELASERYWNAVRKEIEQGYDYLAAQPVPQQPRLPLLLAQLRELCVKAIVSGREMRAPSAEGIPGAALPESMQTGRLSPLDVLSSRYAASPHVSASSVVSIFDIDVSDVCGPCDDDELLARTLACNQRFEQILRALYLQCIPERQADILDILEEAVWQTDVVEGLRVLFELLELMRLDATNAYVLRNAPLIREVAAARERAYFSERVISGRMMITRTILWYRRAAQRASPLSLSTAGSSTDDRDYLATATATSLSHTLATGLMDLIIEPLQLTTGALALLKVTQDARHSMPEILQQDAERFRVFGEDLTDLCVTHLLLLLFQQLLTQGLAAAATQQQQQPRPAAAAVRAAEKRLKAQCFEVLSRASERYTAEVRSGSPLLSGKMARANWRREVQRLAICAWREAHALVVPASSGGGAAITIGDDGEPDGSTTAMLRAWVQRNVTASSHLYRLSMRRVQERILAALQRPLAAYVLDHCSVEPRTTSHHSVEPRTTSHHSGPGSELAQGRQQQPRPQCGTSERPRGHAPTCIARHLYADLGPLTAKRLLLLEADEADLNGVARSEASFPASATSASSSTALASEWAASLQRAGLAPLSAELEAYAARLARFAMLHLEVYGVLYSFLAKGDGAGPAAITNASAAAAAAAAATAGAAAHAPARTAAGASTAANASVDPVRFARAHWDPLAH